MKFREERGIGYCGLACVLCSNQECPGCAAKISGGEECTIVKCMTEKSHAGCYACTSSHCGEAMLQNKRIRAFNRFAREFGVQALMDSLRVNFDNGIMYHKPDSESGDYDVPKTEEEIYQLLRYGAVG